MKRSIAASVVAVGLSTVAMAPCAVRAVPSIELVVSSHVGSRVDRMTGANVCTVASGKDCQRGVLSSKAGGFMYLSSVAVDPRSANVYVADNINNRVQELTATGAFVAMFGSRVDKTKAPRSTASRAERDVCTAASADVCGAGAPGSAAGQLAKPSSVGVDPLNGDVYVLESGGGDFRVDRYTAGGRLVWAIGKRVNASTGGDVCTAREVGLSSVKCTAGAQIANATTAPYAFKFAQSEGNLLAVGGPEDLLYVGDEHRVQEFAASGRWRGQILLTSLSAEPGSVVAALTIDQRGNLYVVYHALHREASGSGEGTDVIHKFAARGEQVAAIPVYPRQANATVNLNGLAIDSSGRLAVIGGEVGDASFTRFGALYDAGTGARISDFAVPSDNDGIALSAGDDLYIAATDDQEVVAYVPAPVERLFTSPTPCQLGRAHDRFNAFNCAVDE